MSIFSSITDYFGSSAKHASNASTHLSSAGSSAYKGASSVVSGVSNFFSTTTALAAGTAWHSFEWIAGEIIGANSAAHFANWGASLVGGAQATGWIAQATEIAALSLVQYPVASMVGLMATTIIATHPKETFEAIKGFGKAAYNFVEAGVELMEAAAEATLAVGLAAVEVLDSAIDATTKELESLTKDVLGGDIEMDVFADNSDVDLVGDEPVIDADCVVM